MQAKIISKEWQKAASRTENIASVPDWEILPLLHTGMGLATESGEFLDALKKHIFYNAPLDKTNLIEELGDVMWYILIAMKHLNIDLDDVIAKNIAKLKVRYPERFTEEAAADRDLAAERQEIE